MKQQGKVWLAAGLALIAAACSFDDPTSSLREGPTRITLTRAAMTIRAGDSLDVQAFLRDAQGNQLPITDAAWSSSDPSIADVHVDVVRTAPGGTFSRAFVLGVSNQAGVTTVSVTSQGITNQFRVTVLPASFPGVRQVTGTAGADTVTINRPAPLTPLVVTYTAGDTLVLTATATVTFNATTAGVNFGPFAGYIVSRSATTLKVISRQPFAGRATITNLVYAGTPETGPIAIATLPTDSFQIQHGRFRGAIVLSNSAFGTNTQFSLTPAAGTTFTVGAGAAGSQVFVGSTPAIILTQTANSIIGILPGTVTAGLMVTRVNIGTAVADSLRTAANTTVNASFFPGTVVNGAGGLLDTVVVWGGGTATFKAGANGACTAASSILRIGGQAAFMLRCTTDSLYGIAKVGSAVAASIDSVVVAGVTIPSLQTPAAVNASTVATGEPNEPANDDPTTAPVLNITGTTAAAPLVLYGAIADGGDVDDFYDISVTTAGLLRVTIQMVGTTGGGGPLTPDVDLLICNAACSAFITGGTAGATTANPEVINIANVPVGNYRIWINGYDTGGATVTYRMTINR